MIRDHGEFKLRYDDVSITDADKEKYGFITRYNIGTVDGKFCYGHIIQKYTGNIVNHPTGTHREKVWLYEWQLNDDAVKGEAISRAAGIDLLLKMIRKEFFE